MYQLLSTPEKRQLDIIAYLIEQGGSYPVDDLLRALDVSMTVLNHDIVTLNSRHDMLSIAIENHYVKLKHSYHINDFTIYQTYMRQLNEFKLLQYVFEESHDKKQIATALNISDSTLNRMITKLNDNVLSKFNLSIETPSMKMKGSEKRIRIFYLALYNELFPPGDDTLFSLTVDFGLLDDLALYFDLSMDIGSFHTFKILYYINATRCSKGYKVHYVDSQIDEIKTTLFNPEDLIYLKQLAQTYFNVTDYEGLYEQLFFPYLEYIYIPNNDLLDARLNRCQDLKDHYLSIKRALSNIQRHFNFNYSGNFAVLILSVYNSLQLQTYEASYVYVGYNRAKVFSHNIRKHYLSFYTLVFKEFYEVYDLTHTQLTYEEFIENVIQILFFSCPDLTRQLTDPPQNLRLLVMSIISKNHAQMIKRFIHRFFPNQVEVDVYDELEIDYDYINSQHYDGILTNFDLTEIEEAEIIVYDNFPTFHSYYAISKLLEKMNLREIKNVT